MNTIDKIIESLKDRINNCTTTREDVGRKSAWIDALVMMRELKSSLEQEEKEQRVTAEEWLKSESYPMVMTMTFSNLVNILERFRHDFRNSGRDEKEFISFANYFHNWKRQIQRGKCPKRPDEIFKEWENWFKNNL